MIDADQTGFLVLFIAVALLAHIGSRLLTPFKRIVRITGEPSYFDFDYEDLEVRSVVKFRVFYALKWAAVGVAAGILVF